MLESQEKEMHTNLTASGQKAKPKLGERKMMWNIYIPI